MGRRFFCNRAPDYVSFSQKWPRAGSGRWRKRQLSKARRRYGRLTAKGHRARLPVHIESEVNYKGW